MAAQKLTSFATRLVLGGAKLVTKTGAGAMVLAQRAQPHLKTFWGHAKVELTPPNPAQWPEIKTGFSNLFQNAVSGRFLDLSVKEATKKTLVGVEILCWFFVGEMIGRRSLIGYKV